MRGSFQFGFMSASVINENFTGMIKSCHNCLANAYDGVHFSKSVMMFLDAVDCAYFRDFKLRSAQQVNGFVTMSMADIRPYPSESAAKLPLKNGVTSPKMHRQRMELYGTANLMFIRRMRDEVNYMSPVGEGIGQFDRMLFHSAPVCAGSGQQHCDCEIFSRIHCCACLWARTCS